MNFQTILEELDRLYEAAEVEQEAEVPVEEQDDEEILIVDDEEEADPLAAEDPAQLVLECANCGALVIKQAAEVSVDDSTDLANVEEKCLFCDEADGFKVIGTFAPYESSDESEDTDEEAKDAEEVVEDGEELEEGIFDKKLSCRN